MVAHGGECHPHICGGCPVIDLSREFNLLMPRNAANHNRIHSEAAMSNSEQTSGEVFDLASRDSNRSLGRFRFGELQFAEVGGSWKCGVRRGVQESNHVHQTHDPQNLSSTMVVDSWAATWYFHIFTAFSADSANRG